MIFSYARFSRPFARPFVYGNSRLENRTGLIFRLQDERGIYFSEASPLMSHSRESVEDILLALSKLGLRDLPTAKFDKNLPPSLRFALESLLLERNNPPFLNAIESNALLPMAPLSELLPRINSLKVDGYLHIKLKISPIHIPLLKELLSMDLSVRWRLDANQSFGENEISSLFHSISAEAWKNVEYLEEPLASWHATVLKDAPVDLAVDESVRDEVAALALVEKLGKCPVFILKPTVWGGLEATDNFARIIGWERVVVTSTLESEVGRRAILRWLSSGYPIQRAAGLSNGSLWKENFMKDQSCFKNLPAPNAEEINWLKSLDWKRI